MKPQIDEITLTAFALGEMEEADRAAVEAQLAHDEGARQYVADIHATALVLREELAREPDIGLTEIQHAAIARRLDGGLEPIRLPPRARHRINWAMWGSLAASIVIVCTVMATVLPKIYHIGHGVVGIASSTVGENQPPLLPPQIPPLENTQRAVGWPRPFPREAVGAPEGAAAPGATINGGECAFADVIARPVAVIPRARLYGVNGNAYTAVQHAIAQGRLPSPSIIRTDELVNAFSYQDPAIVDGAAVGTAIESADCPWSAGHRLVRLALKLADGTAAPSTITRVTVEFNPATVRSYRLIGCEHPVGDELPSVVGDATDEGQGSRHIMPGASLVALYELIPSDSAVSSHATPAASAPLKYQKITITPSKSRDLLTLSVDYRTAAGTQATLNMPATYSGHPVSEASEDFKFSAAVAAFGMVLGHSENRGAATLSLAQTLATEGRGADPSGQRAEFIQLIQKARSLTGS